VYPISDSGLKKPPSLINLGQEVFHMARKGQIFLRVDSATKIEIIEKYRSGAGSARTLSEEYSIPFYTVRTWIKAFNKGIDIAVDRRGKASKGRPKAKSLTADDYREQVEILKKYQAFLGARTGRK